MKYIAWLIFAAFILSQNAFAQTTTPIDKVVTGTINGTGCNANGIGTSPANTGCLKVNTNGTRTVTVQIDPNSGWSGALTFESRVGPTGYWRTHSVVTENFTGQINTFTGSGLILADVSGRSEFRVRAYSVSSGTVSITINAAAGDLNFMQLTETGHPVISSTSAAANTTPGFFAYNNCTGHSNVTVTATATGAADVELTASVDGTTYLSLTGVQHITSTETFIFSDVISIPYLKIFSPTTDVGLTFTISCMRLQ